MHYYLNYSGEPKSFAYPYGGGTEVLTGRAVAAGSNLAVGAWDAAIIEEGRP
jgi:beta-galactosidase